MPQAGFVRIICDIVTRLFVFNVIFVLNCCLFVGARIRPTPTAHSGWHTQSGEHPDLQNDPQGDHSQ